MDSPCLVYAPAISPYIQIIREIQEMRAVIILFILLILLGLTLPYIA